MIKAVYDTNVIVSGLLRPEGIPAFLLDLATQGHVKLWLSQDILKEYEEVLRRPKFDFSPRLVKGLLRKLRSKGKVVKPRTTVTVLKDSADNRFLECALSGKVHYLVTGNTRHFPFKTFRGIKIVTPQDFWEIYKESLMKEL